MTFFYAKIHIMARLFSTVSCFHSQICKNGYENLLYKIFFEILRQYPKEVYMKIKQITKSEYMYDRPTKKI